MKTIDVIRTIKWIDEQTGDTTKKALFSRQLFRVSENNKPTVEIVLKISNEIAITQQKILLHPFALKVLEAFKIKELFDTAVMSKVLSTVLEKGEPVGMSADIWKLFHSWDIMIACVRPFQELTIPPEITQEVDFDETLTIQIIRPDESQVSLEDLSLVIGYVSDLYQVISSLNNKASIEPLQVVYISSGSALRFDLKGLGEPIRQIKNLLVEGWSLWRHRKATDLTENSRALLASLKTLGEIEKKVKDGSLKRHDAEALKARIQKSMLGLYGEGALPREVPTVESLSNLTLLEVNSQKLLTAPAVQPGMEVPEPMVTVEEVAPHDKVSNEKKKGKKGVRRGR